MAVKKFEQRCQGPGLVQQRINQFEKEAVKSRHTIANAVSARTHSGNRPAQIRSLWEGRDNAQRERTQSSSSQSRRLWEDRENAQLNRIGTPEARDGGTGRSVFHFWRCKEKKIEAAPETPSHLDNELYVPVSRSEIWRHLPATGENELIIPEAKDRRKTTAFNRTSWQPSESDELEDDTERYRLNTRSLMAGSQLSGAYVSGYSKVVEALAKRK
ncbi:MAG: hypothetical protein KVP17_002179 [Porospora cf. gigantea B]|nr:MAG: hypothetical protein KVP17_002179 [Porospora cf. gigantea B]